MTASSTLAQVFVSTLLGYGEVVLLILAFLIIPLKIFLGDFFKRL